MISGIHHADNTLPADTEVGLPVTRAKRLSQRRVRHLRLELPEETLETMRLQRNVVAVVNLQRPPHIVA